MRRKGHFSNRDKLLRQVFKHLSLIGVWKENEYHAFCQWATGKSDAELQEEMTY